MYSTGNFTLSRHYNFDFTKKFYFVTTSWFWFYREFLRPHDFDFTKKFYFVTMSSFWYHQEILLRHDVVILISPRNFTSSRRCDSGPNCRCMRFMTTAAIFYLRECAFSPIDDIPSAKQQASCTVLENKVYVGGEGTANISVYNLGEPSK